MVSLFRLKGSSWIVSLSLLLFILVSSFILYIHFHGYNLNAVPRTQVVRYPSPTLVNEMSTNCSDTQKIGNLNLSAVSNLQKLSYYQDICGSYVTNTLMIFTNMPVDAGNISRDSEAMAQTLKEFSKYNLIPIVIVEPTDDNGDNINFNDFLSGKYDTNFNMYFKDLLSYGIKDSQMGMWVPYPEANTPEFDRGSTTPGDFSSLVNTYVTIMKSYFPNSKASILLSSLTYSLSDVNEQNGDYVSFDEYISGIKPSLISSFGIQGFPWIPAANVHDKSYIDPSIYLAPKLAIEAANTLGTKEIWFNTGTFRGMHLQDKSSAVYMSADQRLQILDGVVETLQKVNVQGYQVSVNLFSGDKSDTPEATDWSYTTDPEVFKGFVKQLVIDKIGLSIFDE